jgi:hypothetical protein
MDGIVNRISLDSGSKTPKVDITGVRIFPFIDPGLAAVVLISVIAENGKVV